MTSTIVALWRIVLARRGLWVISRTVWDLVNKASRSVGGRTMVVETPQPRASVRVQDAGEHGRAAYGVAMQILRLGRSGPLEEAERLRDVALAHQAMFRAAGRDFRCEIFSVCEDAAAGEGAFHRWNFRGRREDGTRLLTNPANSKASPASTSASARGGTARAGSTSTAIPAAKLAGETRRRRRAPHPPPARRYRRPPAARVGARP